MSEVDRVVIVGCAYTITPAADLGPGERDELLLAKSRYERQERIALCPCADKALRAEIRLQIPDLAVPLLEHLGHDELLRIRRACDRATERGVQATVAEAGPRGPGRIDVPLGGRGPS